MQGGYSYVPTGAGQMWGGGATGYVGARAAPAAAPGEAQRLERERAAQQQQLTQRTMEAARQAAASPPQYRRLSTEGAPAASPPQYRRLSTEGAPFSRAHVDSGHADSSRLASSTHSPLSRTNADLHNHSEMEMARMARVREDLLMKDETISELKQQVREREGIMAATAEACQIMRGEADNLTRTNMELLGSISALNNRVKECEYTIANRDASIEELQRIVDNVEKKLQGASSAHQQKSHHETEALGKKLAEMEQELRESRAEVWTLAETNSVLRKEQEELNKSKQALAHTNMKLIEKVEALSAASARNVSPPQNSHQVAELQALRHAAENSEKEKERLEQTIMRERTRIKALEHEKELMKSNREGEAERWEQRARDLEADIVRKNKGIEDLQNKLNDAWESQEKLQQNLARGAQSVPESPDKTKKLNSVIFNMSEKVEDLRTRLKELEVERDDATEAVRMQEEQIIKLQEKLKNPREASGSNGASDASLRIEGLEEQVRDLNVRLSKAASTPAADLAQLRRSMEEKHQAELARLHAMYQNRTHAASSTTVTSTSPPREYIALDKARRSFPPSLSPTSSPERPVRPQPTVLAASPPRATAASLSPPRARLSPSHVSPSRYQIASPDTSPSRSRVTLQSRTGVESGAPYRVLKVGEMMDEQGRYVQDWVQPADELVKIDGFVVVDAPVFEVFNRLGGNVGSMVELQLRSHSSGRQYQIRVQRHAKSGLSDSEAIRALSPDTKDSWDSSSDDE